MKINNYIDSTRFKVLKTTYVKKMAKKTSESFNVLSSKIDNPLLKKLGVVGLPIKYYLVGLAIPLPGTSTIGFLIGTGVMLKKIVKKKYDTEKVDK